MEHWLGAALLSCGILYGGLDLFVMRYRGLSATRRLLRKIVWYTECLYAALLLLAALVLHPQAMAGLCLAAFGGLLLAQAITLTGKLEENFELYGCWFELLNAPLWGYSLLAVTLGVFAQLVHEPTGTAWTLMLIFTGSLAGIVCTIPFLVHIHAQKRTRADR